MKNRIASLFLVFALLMSLCTFAVARDNRITVQSGGAERFTDVPASHWAYDYINKVVGSGLFNGKTPTTFEPSNAMTRSQFVMVMARMEGRSDLEGVVTQTIFPDVTTTRRAAGPIAWATTEGFVQGFGDGTFKPDSPITRGQFAALIHRYIVAKRYVNLHVVDPEPAQFTDAASVSTAFTNDVEYARVHGLLTGYSDGTVRASNPITRAAIAAILARFLDLVSESGYTPLLDGPVIDGGDSGDSGNTDTPPVDVPTEYDDVKLKISGETHGTTALVVTRDGKTVDSDDVQAGDLVTVTHVPDSGYGVRVTVKNSKNKTVKKTTANNKTTFTVPSANLPVTVTVTYSKSGSSGGGGGGGSSGGGGSIVTPTYYYATVNASVTATAADSATHGKVFLSTTAPTTAWTVPAPADANDKQTSASNTFPNSTTSITGYVVFVPDTGYELDGVPQGASSVQSEAVTITALNVTLANGAKAFSFTATGKTPASNAPTITISAAFKKSGETPVGALTWTVTPQVSGGFVEISETAFADDKGQVTANAGPSSFQLKKGESKTIYVAVSPDTTQKYSGVPNLTRTDGDVKLANPTPTAKLDNKLFLYTIELNNIQANTTTVLEGAFTPDPVSAPAYKVTVADAEYSGGTLPEGVTLLNPYAEVTEAQEGKEVTIYVRRTTGYQLKEFTVTGDSSKTAYPATLTSAADADPLVYVFTMPKEDVTAKAVFEDVPDPNLTYKVNVTIEGEGTMTLNIGGEDVKFDASGNREVTLKTSAYVAQYGDKYANRALPVYLGAAPVPAQGYKYDASNSLTTSIKNSTKENPDVSLTPGQTLELKVVFIRERSFGYNLTVIGKGSVVVNFNGTTQPAFANDTDGMKTTSHSEFIEGKETVNVAVSSATPADAAWVFDSDVLINDESKALNANYSMSEGMVDIVVAFRKADAKPVAFTVKIDNANGNAVTLRAENGKFFEGAMPDNEDTAISNLKSASAKSAATVSKTTTYYAYDSTIITLVPQLATGYKVDKILVNGSGNVADELPAKGFSYTLPQNSSTTLEITFSKFDQYRALVQAPYSVNGAALSIGDLHSSSRKIAGDRTLQDVLYSFNNGQSLNTTFTPAGNGIENNVFATFGNLTKIAGVYLNTTNSEGKTPAEDLAETLEKSVAASLKANLSSMVEAQKNEMVKPTNANGQDSDLQKQIKSSLKAALSNTQVQPVTATLDNDSKAAIVKAILDSADAKFRAAYDEDRITFDDFKVTATVTPLLLSSDEQGIDKAAGKSVEAQLQSFITDYLLNYLAIRMPNSVDVDIDVTAQEQSGVGTVITVSAKALFAANDMPELAPSETFNAYVNPANAKSKLSIWLKTVANVTLESKEAALNTEFNNAVKPQTDVFSSSKVNADVDNAAIQNALKQVDSTIETTWNDKWDVSKSGSLVTREGANAVLKVSMGQVMTKEMLDAVVEGDATDANNNGMLDDALTTLTDKVSSLGSKDEATATKAAVLNIYRDFVVFNAGQNDNLIALKTKGDETKVIGKITADGDLALTLNFNDLFKDVSALTDQTSFEKLIDLATALRDGLSTDIRNNSNGSAQAVFASLIQGQISKKGQLIATKWGATISSNGANGRRMTDVEKKELADLTAELLMQPLDTKMDDAWKNFEEKGYRSVSMSFNVDEGRFPEIVTALKNFDRVNSAFGDEIRAGFKVDQKLESDS